MMSWFASNSFVVPPEGGIIVSIHNQVRLKAGLRTFADSKDVWAS